MAEAARPADEKRLTPGTVIARSEDVMEAELDGEIVMMSVLQGEYYGLDEVGSAIWKLLEEPRSVEDICDALIAEYEVESEQCRRDVTAFLEVLASDGTLRVVDDPAAGS